MPRGEAPRAIIVHSLDDARAACRAARALSCAVMLRSAPAAAGYAGPGWWRELIAAARAEFPDVAVADALDCGASAGDALAALRAGIGAIRTRAPKRARDRIAAIARRSGARVDADRRAALDLQGLADPESACRSWLCHGRKRRSRAISLPVR